MAGIRSGALALAALVVLGVASSAGAQGADDGSSGGISGEVVDNFGTHLEGICVVLDGETEARTDASGRYRLTRVAVGGHYVRFVDCEHGLYEPAFSEGDHVSSAVEVVAGQVTEHVDGRLFQVTGITGRITDAAGNPLEGICVLGQALTRPPPGTAYLPFADETDGDGTYLLTDVPPTTVAFRVEDCRSPDSDLVGLGRTFEMELHRTVRGVDITLRPGGRIGGTVTDFGGNPLSGICVLTATADGTGGFSMRETGGDGRYQTRALPDGKYTVLFATCPQLGPATIGVPGMLVQYYREQAIKENADQVSIQNGQTVGGIDSRLVPGPTACVVPDLTGRRVRRAEAVLESASCEAGKVRRRRSAVPAGRVIGQQLDLGVVRPEDKRVGFVVSAGKAR